MQKYKGNHYPPSNWVKSFNFAGVMNSTVFYSAPEVLILEVKTEGVFCQSGVQNYNVQDPVEWGNNG